jgi:hypothetical protein
LLFLYVQFGRENAEKNLLLVLIKIKSKSVLNSFKNYNGSFGINLFDYFLSSNQSRDKVEKVKRQRIIVFCCRGVFLSMLAEDVAPCRLEK